MVDINLILAEHQTLATERLILRKLQLEDATEMFNYASNPEVVRYTSFEPHDSVETTKSTIANFFLPDGLNHWGIVEKTSGQLIGEIFLNIIKEKIVEFGWILNQNSWGKGYMPEAARCLFKLCFNELGIEVIQAEHLTENSKSGRVMEKLGMKHLGKVYSYFPKFKQPILTDYWAITKNEYTLLH
ncbi:acetyl transferase [Lactococcus cremoris]|uniref:Acetyl transferase n=1 Tax=Lactococcus lactis subsp. cremoris TaxID=1359 RepID=A0A166JSN5_LACLC|nr:GNAT family N-acetyltransferase [Lactococcus cremoris]KZK06600.1 acetyl transferase [Lactococcus cremoris]